MSKKGLIIAIDGMSASFKTTVAENLAERLNAEGVTTGIVHCDDFFLPEALRTVDRFAEPGGNIHYERMKEEVIDRLLNGEEVAFRPFDCSQMDFGAWQRLADCQVYILEGAYAMHPYFTKYYDMSVFMKAERSEQLARIQKRSGNVDMFEKRWIPLEEKYQRAFDIEANADFVIDITDAGRDITTIIYKEIKKNISYKQGKKCNDKY